MNQTQKDMVFVIIQMYTNGFVEMKEFVEIFQIVVVQQMNLQDT